jgi:hypothetical protein
MNSKDTIQTREHEHFSDQAHISDEALRHFPNRLREIIELETDPECRTILAVSVLVSLSAGFTRWHFSHGVRGRIKTYSPHMGALIIGPPASGKSIMEYGPLLLERIRQQARELQKKSFDDYRRESLEFKIRCERRKKEKQNIGDLIEPPKPRRISIFAAADTSQAGFVQMLADNPPGLLMFETELDTLTQANGKEFGDFSDLIRKSTGHEHHARQRKGEGEDLDIEEIRLAILCSGTYGQLKRLVRSEENGLFSRFAYFVMRDRFTPYEAQTEQVDRIGALCLETADYVEQVADYWNPETYHIEFTPEQELRIAEAFQDKQMVYDTYGGHVGASWNRLGLIVKRCAVTLAAYRQKIDVVPDSCLDAALAILPVFKKHCLTALELIRQNVGLKEIDREEYERLKGDGLTEMKISKEMGVSRPTLLTARKRWKMQDEMMLDALL